MREWTERAERDRLREQRDRDNEALTRNTIIYRIQYTDMHYTTIEHIYTQR